MLNRNQNLTGSQINAMVREEDLEELEGLLKELRDRTGKSHDDGRVFMMAVYTDLTANVSTRVHKVRARFNRESLAGMRRDHKELKLQSRVESPDSSQI